MRSNRALNVLMVVGHYPPNIGGAGVQCKKIAEAINVRFDAKVEVLTVRQPGHLKSEAVQYRTRVHWVPLVGIPFRGIWRGSTLFTMVYIFFFILLCGRKYDIVHIHQAQEPAVAAVAAAKIFGKKTVVKISNSGGRFDLKSLYEKFCGPWLLSIVKRADVFIALTSLIHRELVEWGIPQEKIVDLPNATGLKIDHKPAISMFFEKGNVLVYTGGYLRKKKLDLLIDVIERVNANGTPCCLALIGDGPLRNELRDRVQQRGLNDRVLLYDAVYDVIPYLKTSDVFVQASENEGLSNSLLEALSCGLPAIVTDTEFNREIRELFPQAVKLVQGDDITAWAETVVSVLGSLPSKERLRCEINDQLHCFSLEDVSERCMNLYRQMIDVMQ